MQKKKSWKHIAYFFVGWRTYYCAGEKPFLQIGLSRRTSTANAIPKTQRKAAIPSPRAATTPSRLQRHQKTNTLERREKRPDSHQSRRSRVLHACALWCLATYFCLIPVFHYAWIRGSLPMRGVVSGHVLAAATVVALLSFWLGVPQWLRSGWPSIAIVGMFSSAAFVLLLVGWRVHYRMEVRG